MTASPDQLTERRRRLDRITTLPMNAAAMVSLLALAGLLHFSLDARLSSLALACGGLMLLVYPLFVCEAVADVLFRARPLRQVGLHLILPPFRMTARDRIGGKQIWFPGFGWQTVDDSLVEKLERQFSIPMMGVALLVLPLVAMEYVWAERIETNATLSMLTSAATALIWFAFTLEFLMMISVVPKKLAYCKQHWIDIIVILMPLVAFLRVLRLGGLLRMQQLSKTVRLYKVRGILTRAYRAILILELIDRILRPKPEQQLENLRRKEAAALRELTALRSRIAELEQKCVSGALRTADASAPDSVADPSLAEIASRRS